MIRVSTQAIAFDFSPELGLLENLAIEDDGVTIRPLHTAPWVDSPEPMPDDAAPHMARLGGDFFCAPFGDREDGSPLHGWPPNSSWTMCTQKPDRLEAKLDRTVMGATLTKHLTVRDGHPFLYQEHAFSGGQGRISVANHANLSLPDGGLISTSPKRHWETPSQPLETDAARGRSALVYPASSGDPAHFPAVNGEADLTQYPWGDAHEDFAIGVEATGHALGWTAVVRPAQGDCFVSLRNPSQLPMTMLWHSNGGRDYAPWNGRHTGCLGIEEGAAAPMLGVATGDQLAGPGQLELGGEHILRHAIGACRWPSGERVTDIRIGNDVLVVVGEDGSERSLPFDIGFLKLKETSHHAG